MTDRTRVDLPYRATRQEVRLLMEVCKRISEDRDLQAIDATQCERFEPIGTTMVAAAIARRIDSGLSPLTFVPPEHPEARAFLEEVHFERFTQYPPIEIDPRASSREMRHLTKLNPLYTEDIANMIASRVPGTTEDTAHYIQLCLNELIQNVFEHADSKIGCFVHSRWFAADRNVRLAVVDCGRGIPAALRREQKLGLHAGRDAELVRDAVTRKGLTSRRSGVGGLGLKHIHDIVTMHRGRLVVMSHNAKVVFVARKKPLMSSSDFFRGTAIEIDFRPHEEIPDGGLG